MKKDNHNIKKAKEWFAIGDDEFGYAELGLKDKKDKFYAQISFYCHQSIEKYFKGYLSFYNKKIEKTHDLEKLCGQCLKINPGFRDFMVKCRRANKYYIPTRYPLHYEIFQRKHAEEAYEIAKSIISFIKKDLKRF